MLCQVHGCPQLHLSKAQDAQSPWVITIGGDLQQVHLCEQENYDITMAACQPSEPRLTWVKMTGVMLESSSEGQPLRVAPERDFPMRYGSMRRSHSVTSTVVCGEIGKDPT
jgi:hypothetical protein